MEVEIHVDVGTDIDVVRREYPDIESDGDEGNGGWAQSMISRKDFDSLAISKKEKQSYKRTSNLFWKHFNRGKKSRITKTKL